MISHYFVHPASQHKANCDFPDGVSHVADNNSDKPKPIREEDTLHVRFVYNFIKDPNRFYAPPGIRACLKDYDSVVMIVEVSNVITGPIYRQHFSGTPGIVVQGFLRSSGDDARESAERNANGFPR